MECEHRKVNAQTKLCEECHQLIFGTPKDLRDYVFGILKRCNFVQYQVVVDPASATLMLKNKSKEEEDSKEGDSEFEEFEEFNMLFIRDV